MGYLQLSIVHAATRQLRELPYATGDLELGSEPPIRLAAELARLGPGDLNRIYFTMRAGGALLHLSDPARGATIRAALGRDLPEIRFVERPEEVSPANVRFPVTWTSPERMAERFPALELVFSTGAGVDQFDFGVLPSRARLVRMVDDDLAEQMREYGTMAVLMVHRHLPAYLAQQRARPWCGLAGTPARVRRVGIMGVGQLGRTVIDALRPFGFPLAGWSRGRHDLPDVESYAGADGLAPFLARTDILVCLLPLTAETEGILDARLFGALPRGAGLVHLGRGRQLDHAALLEALEAGHLSAAVLDVTEPEPLPTDDPIWARPEVTLTPHIACQTRFGAAARHIVDSLRHHHAGEPIPGLVDLGRGY